MLTFSKSNIISGFLFLLFILFFVESCAQTTRYEGTVSKVFSKNKKDTIQNVLIDYHRSFYGSLKIYIDGSIIYETKNVTPNSDFSIVKASLVEKEYFSSSKIHILRIEINNEYMEELIDDSYKYIRIYYEQKNRKLNLYFQDMRIIPY